VGIVQSHLFSDSGFDFKLLGNHFTLVLNLKTYCEAEMKVSNVLTKVCAIATIVILTGSAGHQMENHCPNEQEILPCLCKSRGKNVLVR